MADEPNGAAPAEPKPTAAEMLAEIRSNVQRAVELGSANAEQIEKMKKQYDEKVSADKTRTTGARTSGVDLPGLETEKDKWSWVRAINCIRFNSEKYGKFEWDVMRQAALVYGKVRDLSTDVDSAGGFLVPEQVMPDFVERLNAKMVSTTLGARTLSGLVGSPVRINKQTGDSTAYWVAENAAITESEPTYGTLEMRPREAAALVPVSNQLLARGNPSVEGLIRDEIQTRVALLMDLAVLQGTGGTQPLGIINAPNVNTTSIDAVPDEDDLFDMQYQIELDNVDMQSPGWAMHPRTWNTFRKLKNGQGDHILIPSLANPRTGTLLGFPYALTTQIPINLGGTTDESRLYLGDWSQVLIGRWGGMEISTSQHHSNAFSQNQTFIRIIGEMDVAVRHGEAFCVDSTIRSS